MGPKKVFLCGEMQASVPFTKVNWCRTNALLRTVPGLVRKTWLSGINTHTISKLFEFASLEHARALRVARA